MTETLQIAIDNAGNITIPAELKNRLGLKPGMAFIVELDNNGEMHLRLQSSEPELINKGGVLVVTSHAEDDLSDAVANSREERVATLTKRLGL